MSQSTSYQPIDAVKRGVENILPGAYMAGIILVYAASAAVMSFLLFPSFMKVVGHFSGAVTATVLLTVSIQFMRFLIVFTDSLVAGGNTSGWIVKTVSLAMMVMGVFEVFHATSAIGAASAIALSASVLMMAGGILELLFVGKLNRRDRELEEANQVNQRASI